MNFSDLVAAVEAAGLNASRLVDRVPSPRTVSANTGYSIVDTESGFAVMAGMGRGEITELPDDGYRFASESDACEFVWRQIRSNASPDLLLEEDKRLLRQEAAASIARQTAAYDLQQDIAARREIGVNSSYNVRFLQARLERAQVNSDLYNIGGYAEGCYCIAVSHSGVWETYVGERGEKTDSRVYPTEADACIAFLGLMAWTEWHE